MNHLRIVSPLIFALLLTACGTGTTPPVETPTTPPTNPPVAPAPVISSFTATPPAITSGGSSVLAWSVDDTATAISVSGGVGTVTTDPDDRVVVTPSATTAYTLTATNANGSSTRTVTVTVTSGTTPPTTPGNGVEYYGEWTWEFDFTNIETSLNGQISITEAVTTDGFVGSGGAYQSCGEAGCTPPAIAFGPARIGIYSLSSGERLGVGLVSDLGGDPYVQLVGLDSDNQVTTNSRGEQVIEGQGLFSITSGSDPLPGTFILTKISDLPVIQD